MKRFIGIVCILVLLLTAAACGGEPAASSAASGEDVTETMMSKIYDVEVTGGEEAVFQMKGVSWLSTAEEAMKAQGWSEAELIDESGLLRKLSDEGMFFSQILDQGEGRPKLRIMNGMQDGKLVTFTYDLYYETEEECKKDLETLTDHYRKAFGITQEPAEGAPVAYVGADDGGMFTVDGPTGSFFRLQIMGPASGLPYAMLLNETDTEGIVLRLELFWARGTWANEHLDK